MAQGGPRRGQERPPAALEPVRPRGRAAARGPAARRASPGDLDRVPAAARVRRGRSRWRCAISSRSSAAWLFLRELGCRDLAGAPRRGRLGVLRLHRLLPRLSADARRRRPFPLLLLGLRRIAREPGRPRGRPDRRRPPSDPDVGPSRDAPPLRRGGRASTSSSSSPAWTGAAGGAPLARSRSLAGVADPRARRPSSSFRSPRRCRTRSSSSSGTRSYAKSEEVRAARRGPRAAPCPTFSRTPSGSRDTGRSPAGLHEPAAYAGRVLWPFALAGLFSRRREKWALAA